MFPSFVFDVNGICREIMRENSEDAKERGRRDPFERIAWLRRRRRRRRHRARIVGAYEGERWGSIHRSDSRWR